MPKLGGSRYGTHKMQKQLIFLLLPCCMQEERFELDSLLLPVKRPFARYSSTVPL
jgi:hypothetical protein